MPDEHVLVVQEDTDHVHAVWGKPEELEAAGILKPAKPKEPKTKNLERKPEKPAAKKPAAKHKAKA